MFAKKKPLTDHFSNSYKLLLFRLPTSHILISSSPSKKFLSKNTIKLSCFFCGPLLLLLSPPECLSCHSGSPEYHSLSLQFCTVSALHSTGNPWQSRSTCSGATGEVDVAFSHSLNAEVF